MPTAAYAGEVTNPEEYARAELIRELGTFQDAERMADVRGLASDVVCDKDPLHRLIRRLPPRGTARR